MMQTSNEDRVDINDHQSHAPRNYQTHYRHQIAATPTQAMVRVTTVTRRVSGGLHSSPSLLHTRKNPDKTNPTTANKQFR